MAQLRKRKDRDGKFELDYLDVDGTRYRINTGTTDIKIAKLWLAKAEELLSLAKIGQIEKVGKFTLDDMQGKRRTPEERIRLSKFKEVYQERCRYELELAASTIALNHYALNSFLETVGDKRLNEMIPEDVRKWKRSLIDAGKTKTTVAIYQRMLGVIFNRAVKWKFIDSNPFTEIELPKVEKSRKAMSIEEVRLLLSTIKEEWFKTYLRFVMYTACRRNEILFLKREDIDTTRWVVSVTSQKTGKRLELPINKALRRVIEHTTLPEGYLFPSQKIDGAPWNPDFVTHLFKKYLRRAGLSETYSLHSLRHTYTTFLRGKGVPLDIIQKLLGHSSPGTTDIYDHSEALYFRQLADLVDYEADLDDTP